MARAAGVAGLVLGLLAAAGPAGAQSFVGPALERLASFRSDPNSSSARLLDADVLTLFRWEERELPTAGGGGSSHLRLLTTPIASILERESSSGGGVDRSNLKILPVLGIRLFETESSSNVDPLTGAPMKRSSWGLLKLPVIGPLLGRESSDGQARWRFLFVGG